MSNFTKMILEKELFQKNKREIIIWLTSIVSMILFVTVADESFGSKISSLNDSDYTQFNWNRYTYHHIATFFVFFVLPIIVIKLFLKEPLKTFGLNFRNLKQGWKPAIAAILIATPFIYISSSDPEFLEEYPLTLRSMESIGLFVQWSLIYIFYYLGWEFFFRGFMLNGFKKSGLVQAIMIQTALSTIIHIGKPSGELISAFPAGIFLGILSYRSKSIFWPFIFHWYVGIINSYFCGLINLTN